MSISFLTAQKEVAVQLGLNIGNTDTATLLKRWLNIAYEDIAGFYQWAWLESREAVTMEVDYTTGTASVNSAGTTVTLSDVIASSKTGYFIQFSSAKDWYEITAHTAGTATLTITPAYCQTDNLTDGTFIIRRFYYPLSSAVEYVHSCKQAITPRPIPIIPVTRYDYFRPFTDEVGQIRAIYMWMQDTNGNWEFSPFPFPDSPMLLEFKTIKKVSDLSGDTDVPLFPDRFISTWIWGAKAYGLDFLDDDRAGSSFTKFWNTLAELKKRDSVGLGKHYIMQAVDTRVIRKDIIDFPPEFGNIR